MDTASSRFQRTDGKPLPYADPAGPLRPVKALMAGKAKDVNIHSLHINRQHSGRLGRVYDKQQLSLFAERAESRKIVGVSRQVWRRGYRPGPWYFPSQAPKAAPSRSLPFSSQGQKRHPHPCFFQPVQRTQHRIVLHHRRNYMIPRPKKPRIAVFRASVELLVKATCLGFPSPTSSEILSLVP